MKRELFSTQVTEPKKPQDTNVLIFQIHITTYPYILRRATSCQEFETMECKKRRCGTIWSFMLLITPNKWLVIKMIEFPLLFWKQ